ncbi:hypothetical protein CTM63_00220 [Prevotella intermedia]|uniref:hypothetical protein n=1 Tax=Prevotella intermedia TaxID=28131 RepID=UPI000C1C7371|nr:hypothetical protein [Prevotella intermedia]ATV27710.1 hypothetical protein CTM63_00220 [Prevotella intermedia]
MLIFNAKTPNAVWNNIKYVKFQIAVCFLLTYTENECKYICAFIVTALQRNGRFVAMMKKCFL